MVPEGPYRRREVSVEGKIKKQCWNSSTSKTLEEIDIASIDGGKLRLGLWKLVD